MNRKIAYLVSIIPYYIKPVRAIEGEPMEAVVSPPSVATETSAFLAAISASSEATFNGRFEFPIRYASSHIELPSANTLS
jgi:hypothetical protein